jgi:hypothetical protein
MEDSKSPFRFFSRALDVSDNILRIIGAIGLAIMIVGTIVAYVQHIRELPSWWHFLFIVGVALVLLAVIGTVLKWNSRRHKEETLADTKSHLLGDKVSAFYTTRITMLKSPYGGIFKELETSKQERGVCAAWHSGQIAKEIAVKGLLGRISQLILLHPWNQDLGRYIDEKKWTVPEARQGIVQATRIFQDSGIEVRWFDGPFSNITIVDRQDPIDARVRVEPWLPLMEPPKWQNYVVYQKDNLDAYNNIVGMFDAMWDHRKWTTAAPTGEELERFKDKNPNMRQDR